MQLKEIDADTEDTYYRCLHDEVPADPRVMAMRREWRARYQPLGHRAKVLIDDTGLVIGLTNYIPVEHSPYEGDNLMAFLCMWIHGYDHHVGNQQQRGYGRFMLDEIEADARRSGCDGVTVWAKDYDAWNPVSFYEHMGYRRVDQDGLDVLVFKPFKDTAREPAFVPHNRPQQNTANAPVQVTSVRNGWCGGGCSLCVMTRDALADMDPEVVQLTEIYAHTKDDIRHRGESIDVVYIGDEPFRPDGPPPSAADLRQAVLDRAAARKR